MICKNKFLFFFASFIFLMNFLVLPTSQGQPVELTEESVTELIEDLEKQKLLKMEDAQLIKDELKKLEDKDWQKANKVYKKVNRSIASTPEGGPINSRIVLPNRSDSLGTETQAVNPYKKENEMLPGAAKAVDSIMTTPNH